MQGQFLVQIASIGHKEKEFHMEFLQYPSSIDLYKYKIYQCKMFNVNSFLD